MRYLSVAFLESTLNRGATIEQFMGGVQRDGEQFIRWVELRPCEEGVEIWDYEVPDLGAECLDFYAFAIVEQEPLAVVPNGASALELAHLQLGTSNVRWVTQGVSQDEFIDFLRAGRPSPWCPVVA